MANKFKIGDKVVCIKVTHEDSSEIVLGNIYEVVAVLCSDHHVIAVKSASCLPECVKSENFELFDPTETTYGQEGQYVKKSEVLDMRGKPLSLGQEVVINDLSDLHIGQIVDIGDISKDVIVKYTYKPAPESLFITVARPFGDMPMLEHEVQTKAICVKSSKLVGLSDGD